MALPVSGEPSGEGGPFSLFPTRRREEGGRRSLPAGSRRKDHRLCGRLAGGWGPSPSGKGQLLGGFQGKCTIGVLGEDGFIQAAGTKPGAPRDRAGGTAAAGSSPS